MKSVARSRAAHKTTISSSPAKPNKAKSGSGKAKSGRVPAAKKPVAQIGGKAVATRAVAAKAQVERVAPTAAKEMSVPPTRRIQAVRAQSRITWPTEAGPVADAGLSYGDQLHAEEMAAALVPLVSVPSSLPQLSIPREQWTLAQRAAVLLQVDVDYIDSPDFQEMQRWDDYLAAPPASQRTQTPAPPKRDGLPAYLNSLYDTPLLSPEQEVHEFRRFNLLKHKAATLLKTLSPSRPARAKIEAIEQAIEEADHVRNQIVKANLRLVVANARKFADFDHTFEDLVSDGNLSLVQAVEKFDYSRGFRFSTYATHAIRRTYFRRMNRRQKEKTRLVFTGNDVLQDAPQVDQNETMDRSQLQLYKTLLQRMGERLNERELLILKARFSLEQSGEVPTLQVLATDLGICKERVRQLQNRAIEKLRHLATEIQTDLAIDLPRAN